MVSFRGCILYDVKHDSSSILKSVNFVWARECLIINWVVSNDSSDSSNDSMDVLNLFFRKLVNTMLNF